jgi:hypothetical protein
MKENSFLKKIAISIGVMGTAICILGIFNYQLKLCSDVFDCYDFLSLIGRVTLVFLPFLVFAIITTFLDAKLQRIWFFFSIPWVILTVIISVFVPTGGGPAGFYGAYERLGLMFLLAGYVLISLLILSVRSWITWRNGTN